MCIFVFQGRGRHTRYGGDWSSDVCSPDLDPLFDSVIGALKWGDKIEIRGFGSFRTRQRNARTGRNPKTGAKVDVPAKRVPFFKPSKELRDSVNPNGAVKAKAIAKKAETDHIDPHHPPAM